MSWLPLSSSRQLCFRWTATMANVVRAPALKFQFCEVRLNDVKPLANHCCLASARRLCVAPANQSRLWREGQLKTGGLLTSLRALETLAMGQKNMNSTVAYETAMSEEAAENSDTSSLEAGRGDDQAELPGVDEQNDVDDENAEDALAAMTGTISLAREVPVASTAVCVGIDPDLSGAIAILGTRDSIAVAEVIDVPCVTVTVNKKKRRRHDYESIVSLVRDLRAPEGSVAYVEQAMPFPKDGKQGWYITGYGYGVWLGVLASAGFTVVPVRARVWKAAMGLYGKEVTKDDSRALASSMFPLLSSQLQRKKDHGRAEALLIAAFGKGLTSGSDLSLNKTRGEMDVELGKGENANPYRDKTQSMLGVVTHSDSLDRRFL